MAGIDCGNLCSELLHNESGIVSALGLRCQGRAKVPEHEFNSSDALNNRVHDYTQNELKQITCKGHDFNCFRKVAPLPCKALNAFWVQNQPKLLRT